MKTRTEVCVTIKLKLMDKIKMLFYRYNTIIIKSANVKYF